MTTFTSKSAEYQTIVISMSPVHTHQPLQYTYVMCCWVKNVDGARTLYLFNIHITYFNLYHSTSVLFYFISNLILLRLIDFFSALHGFCIIWYLQCESYIITFWLNTQVIKYTTMILLQHLLLFIYSSFLCNLSISLSVFLMFSRTTHGVVLSFILFSNCTL